MSKSREIRKSERGYDDQTEALIEKTSQKWRETDRKAASLKRRRLIERGGQNKTKDRRKHHN